MTSDRKDWVRARDELVSTIDSLGFPKELGVEIAKQLGSTRAMERMKAYLYYVKPRKAELIVDEMLAIRSDIDSWRDRKMSQEANEKYNEMLYNGLNTDQRE